MVSSDRDTHCLTIIARPNRSATWRANKLVLLALAVPSLGFAVGFALAGAWPIIPFAGLELLALGSALYLVNWKLQYRHVITISERRVCVEKGYYLPRQSWHFERDDTALSIEREQHPWDGPRISLHDRNERVSVGEFLNREECLELLRLLRGELRVGGDAECSVRRF